MLRPLLWANGVLRVLDQTALPLRERWITCRTPGQVARAIRALAIRGAPLLGVAAAYGLALAAKSRSHAIVRLAARLLARSRPTAVNLPAAVARVEAAVAYAPPSRLPALALREARRLHAEDAEMCEAIGRNGARLVPRGARVLTLCNTGSLATGGIGTAHAVLRRARDITVYACETRPVCQGARLTMFELARDRIPAFLIADGAAAAAMREKRIDLVITGADRIARNGDTANKIGTYALALAARAHRIPFYIAAPSTTYDGDIPTGRGIPVEERDPAELLAAAPQGARAWNPAFDVTPARLIRGYITERGVLRASNLETALGGPR